jgi:hypothetical protein
MKLRSCPYLGDKSINANATLIVQRNSKEIINAINLMRIA